MEIKDFKPRLYQETILSTAVNKNTLVVLPTGMGKTHISLLLAIKRLKNFPNSKVLLLAPTKPLANQHLETFKKYSTIPEDKLALFTGYIKPEIREELWKKAICIFSTPQTISNDLINKRINPEEISTLIFDESHRAIGNYDYVWIAKQYHKLAKYPRILALTASPGSEIEKISEVCKNLFIEEIEVRTEDSPDVKPYIQEIDIDWIKVSLPDSIKETLDFLNNCLKEKLNQIKKLGYLNSINPTKKELIQIQASLQGEIARGEKNFQLYRAISLAAEAIKIEHAIEMLETQGPVSLYNYMKDIFENAERTKVKAIKNLAKDLNFKSAYIKVQHLIENNIEHPKIEELKKIIQVNKDKKIIIFNQYRDSASYLEKKLNEIEGVKAKLFVGQLKKGLTGLTQKKQLEIITKFKENFYNILISTSIGEEGLDIPKVDIVIFYEPIPSAIRNIQRRGRTARLEKGKVIILMTKNTRDEVYYWISYNKEKRMYKLLENLKSKLQLLTQKQPTLKNYIKNEIKIIADTREKGSQILKELVNLGLNIKTENLEIADYIISDRVGIELKTKKDFIASIIDKRLIHQIRELRKNFEKPLLIIEGEEDIYSIRNVHPNAIRGMLSMIAISYSIPIISTKDSRDTARLIAIIARREQEQKDVDFPLRLERKPLTTREQQEYIIESFPGIGPTLSKSLLKEFKSIKKIINSEEKDLQKVEKLGPKKAREIKRIIDEEYEEV